MARQCLLLTAKLLLLCGVLHAQNLSEYKARVYQIHSNRQEFQNLNSYLMILQNVDENLSAEEIQKLSLEKAHPYYSPVQSTTQKNAVVWGKIVLLNTFEEEYEWLLFTGNNDLVEVYVLQKDGSLSLKKSGSKTPLSEKDIKKGNESLVLLHLLPHQPTEIYIKIKQYGQKTPVFDLQLVHPEIWQQKILGRNLFQGLFQGILWMMIFYSSFIALVSKDRPYAYYALFLFLTSVFFNHFHYLSAEFLLGDFPWLNSALWFVSALIPPAYLQFVRSFLNIRKILPYWDRVALMLIRVGFLIFVLEILLYSFTLHEQFLSYMHIHAMMGELIASWVVLIKIFNTRQKIARYFSIGAMLSVVNALVGIFLIHYLHIQEGIYWIQVGLILEILVFLFGLGYGIFIKESYRRKIQENMIAQLQKNEKLQNKLNQELEEMVKKRTAEIEQQKNKLEELNFIKDKLFNIISHDLRSPLTSLQGSLQALHLGLLNKEEEKSIYFNLNHKLNYTKSLLDNLLYWAMIQMEKVSTRFEEIDLYKLVGEVLQNFQASNNKKITLKNNVPENSFAMADRNMVLVVIRNLISNALKFTPENGCVQINGRVVDNYLEIEVEDNGIGMDKEEVDRLFKLDTHFSKPGTALEKGTGLGLLLCKEFVLKNEGDIYVKSKKNQGSKFIFTLKRKMNLIKSSPEKYGFSYVILV